MINTINIIMSGLGILVGLLLMRIWKLEKIVNNYKWNKDYAWPQYDNSGEWREYKGDMELALYIKCLEYEKEVLRKILTNKVWHHCGHPFNERVLVLRTIIRDLKLLYNKINNIGYYTIRDDDVSYVRTFWATLKKVRRKANARSN